MIFLETKLPGAFLIKPERREDERGYFSRTWSAGEFSDSGLDPSFVECNVSYNRKRGTLRGMHYQMAPYGQPKLVRCTRGSIYDVIIDLRPNSPTILEWTSVELTEENGFLLYVPKGFAHGFQTLEDDTEVFYQMSAIHVPESAAGVRWNDPIFNIQWPDAERIIIRRDQEYPDFRPPPKN